MTLELEAPVIAPEQPLGPFAFDWTLMIPHAPAMRALFPRTRQMTVKGAGHWVHSEQPDVFVQVLRVFLDANAGLRTGTDAEPGSVHRRRSPAPAVRARCGDLDGRGGGRGGGK